MAMLFRMKYINRWGLMRNTQNENLSQHSLECAVIAHHLAIIGNEYFAKNYNGEKIAVCAMYHDCAEILTGDLPTPVKYYSDEMKKTYSQIESNAMNKLISYLPDRLKPVYENYLSGLNLSEEEKQLIKAADKLCALIKCIDELNAGNKEFSAAFESIKAELEKRNCPELEYFLNNNLSSFTLSLDELEGTL